MKGREVVSDKHSGRLYLRLLSYLRPYWRRLILLFVCTTLFAALSGVSLTLIPPFLNILFSEQNQQETGPEVKDDQSLLIPQAVENRIDRIKDKAKSLIYKGRPIDRLARFCVLFFILMLIKNILDYFSTYLTIYLEQSILHSIRNELYGKLQMLPMSFFDNQKTGHLISRVMNDVTNLRGAIVGGLASIIRNALMTVIAVTIIFYTSWKLSLLTILLVPVNVLLISLISRKLRKGSRRAQEKMADMTSVLQETISGVRVVKAFGMEEFERSKFNIFNFQYLRVYLKMRRVAELASPSSEMLGMIASMTILWYGGRLVIDSELAPANLMMFLVAMLWVVSPIKNLSKLNNVIQEALASGERVFQILDIPTESDRSGERKLDKIERNIIYRSVSFNYE
ncbi:MAG: hypothetical protein KOO63_11875, partial [Bacteroidales bacterium]|nr:hypothetical protein [Candidatus Latescibacterota bacterium]